MLSAREHGLFFITTDLSDEGLFLIDLTKFRRATCMCVSGDKEEKSEKLLSRSVETVHLQPQLYIYIYITGIFPSLSCVSVHIACICRRESAEKCNVK